MSQVEPFEEFLARTTAATPDEYAPLMKAAAEKWNLSPPRMAEEFERMKAYIADFYEGVVPVSSFLGAGGQPVDCIPIEQQPSARKATAPIKLSARPPSAHAGQPDQAPASTACAGICPAGTIPIVRVTLERLIPLGTFENYFRKFPSANGPEEFEKK